jgi:hypothetical protein
VKRLLLGCLALLGLLFVAPPTHAGAMGLKIAPLEYKATLKENERLRGFVDVSNPHAQPVSVQTTVQGFKQIDDDGGLQFFDDERLAAAIKPELSNFELGPREAVRIMFSIDGRALPEGDVFAALYFTTEPPRPSAGVGQSVRVGTILSLVNETPGARKAQVTGLDIPFIQLSETASGSYLIKNTGPAGTGFYPNVTLSSWPGGQAKEQESSLVFSGRERRNDLSLPLGYGIHRVEATFGDSKKGQWVLLIAPWMLVTGLLVAVVIGAELLLLKRRRKSNKKSPRVHTPSTPEK